MTHGTVKVAHNKDQCRV